MRVCVRVVGAQSAANCFRFSQTQNWTASERAQKKKIRPERWTARDRWKRAKEYHLVPVRTWLFCLDRDRALFPRLDSARVPLCLPWRHVPQFRWSDLQVTPAWKAGDRAARALLKRLHELWTRPRQENKKKGTPAFLDNGNSARLYTLDRNALISPGTIIWKFRSLHALSRAERLSRSRDMRCFIFMHVFTATLRFLWRRTNGLSNSRTGGYVRFTFP